MAHRGIAPAANGVVLAALAVLLLLALGMLLARPAAGDTPSPGPLQPSADPPTATAPPVPSTSDQPSSSDEPTQQPTTEGPGGSSEPTPTTGPSTAAPTAASVTPSAAPSTSRGASPSPSARTPAPVVTLPGSPPAAFGGTVPVASALIAAGVLVLAAFLLRELTGVDAAPPGPRATLTEPGSVSEDEVLLLLATAGDALVEAGFDVSDVQADLRRIADANGLREVEILAMPTALIVSATDGRQVRTNAVATGEVQLQLHQIEDLDEVVAAARRGLAPREAIRRISEIRQAPSPFAPAVRLLGGVLATMGVAVLLGSSLIGVGVSGALGVLTGALSLVGLRVPLRFQALVTITAASSVSLTVFLLARTGLSNDVVPALIAPLITFLPGALLTTAVIELASGQMISGAGRLASGGIQLTLLALGIIGPALLVGVPALELTAQSPALGWFGPWLAVAAFGVGIVVNRSVRPRSMGWILIVLYVAYGAQVIGGLVVGGVLSAFVGALAMTPVADLVARQRGGPPAIVSFTPAFWILVPGALGLMGVATLLSGDSAGTASLLTMLQTMVAIALGILVGRAFSTLIGLRRDRSDRITGGPEPV